MVTDCSNTWSIYFVNSSSFGWRSDVCELYTKESSSHLPIYCCCDFGLEYIHQNDISLAVLTICYRHNVYNISQDVLIFTLGARI